MVIFPSVSTYYYYYDVAYSVTFFLVCMWLPGVRHHSGHLSAEHHQRGHLAHGAALPSLGTLWMGQMHALTLMR